MGRLGKLLNHLKGCVVVATSQRPKANRRLEMKEYNILTFYFKFLQLKVFYVGKYYLVDAGYTRMNGFIAPHGGVRYHLKEHNGRAPTNSKELFNLRPSLLGSWVERAFAPSRIISKF